MESKIDYLTLTLKPATNSITLSNALEMLGRALVLDNLLNSMVNKGHFGFYNTRMTYESIELLLPSPHRFFEQGLCLKLSSKGLRYFVAYLKSCNMTLKIWLGMWRGLCFGNKYFSKVTRFDYAMDDIRYNNDTPLLTMDKLIRCAEKGEICKKSRTVDILSGEDYRSRTRIKKHNGEVIKGKTLYIGVRESGCLIRFYDKRAEQFQHKKTLPNSCSSWVRCELEFKGASAMSVLNAFLDYSETEFSDYMRGVLNNRCRFISLNNSNVSRCTTKRWWTKFLDGCTNNFKLPHAVPARTSYARAIRGLSQYTRTIYTMFQVLGLEGIYRFFEDEVEKAKTLGKNLFNSELAQNIRESLLDYETLSPFTQYLYNSPNDELALRSQIEADIMAYHHRYYVLNQNYKIYGKEQVVLNDL